MLNLISENEITRRLKIDTSKPLTEEQWTAYCAAKDEEIIAESSVLPPPGTMGFWSQTLIAKYLRPYSLGPGRIDRWTSAKNRYTRKSVQEAKESIPFVVKITRLWKLGNHESEIAAVIDDENRRIKTLPEAEQAAADAVAQAVLDKLEAADERYWQRAEIAASREAEAVTAAPAQPETNANTIDTMAALSDKVAHVHDALTTMGLDAWVESSRAGTHPKFFSPYGVSESYYIHGRGAKGEVTLRVSDHDNPHGSGSTAYVTVGDTEAKVDATIANFLKAAKKLGRYSAKARKAQLVAHWQREADDALIGVDVVDQVKCAIDARRDCADEAEAAILDAIRDEDITGVMGVLDDECAEGEPTYGQILGAYQHIHYMQMGERLDMDRAWSGNDASRDALAQLAWTKKYYEERFFAWSWSWSCAEHEGHEWAAQLLDEVVEVTEVPA